MALAIGGSGGRPPYGPFRIDVRDYGARAGIDCAAAFQAAVDAMVAKLAVARAANPAYSGTGIVFIPADPGDYLLSTPIWVDSPSIEIRGEGSGTRIRGLHLYPLFIFGMRRVGHPYGLTLVADANYRPDIYGKLDTTAASATGQRWGFRTHGDAFIQMQAGPFDTGAASLDGTHTTENWTETQKLTIEFAVEAAGGGVMPANAVIGSTGDGITACPYGVFTQYANTFNLTFATQSSRHAAPILRTVTLSTGTTTGVQRIAFQVDLTTATVSAYLNGVQKTISTSGFDASWVPGLHFNENEYCPFLIGDGGSYRPNLGSANGVDFNLYGYLLSKSIRYQNNGAGQPQKRVDSPATAVTDSYRYFTRQTGGETDAGVLGYLAFTEDPATHSRLLSVPVSPVYGSPLTAAFLIHSYSNGEGGILNNALRDMSLIGGNTYGQNVMVCQVLDLKISGISSTSSYHSIGTLNNGANYTVHVNDCYLDGSDSGYFAVDQGVWLHNVNFGSAGRATMRFAGCNVDATNMQIAFGTPNSQNAIKIHSADYGGNYAFRNIIVDYEGSVFGHSVFYCETHPYAAATTLKLQDINLGSVGPVPVIMLRDGSGQANTCELMVENIEVYGDTGQTLLRLDGPRWIGEIRHIAGLGGIKRITHDQTYGTEAHVVIRETGFKATPRVNPWCAGAHDLVSQSPVDGQFASWRCVASGAYGTSNPPLWAGLNPLTAKPSGMAAYVLNHGYITVALT